MRNLYCRVYPVHSWSVQGTLCVLVLSLFFSLYSIAEEPKFRPGPTYRHIEPAVAQQGKQVTLTIYGTRLLNVKDILFYRPGIKFKSYEPLYKAYHKIPYTQQAFGPGQAIKVTLEIDKDCPTGRHLFRVQTDEKLSELGALYISPWPCVEEANWWTDKPEVSNDTFETAQSISLGTTAYGFIPSGSVVDNDVYRVEVKKGQPLTVEVWSDVFGYRQRDHDQSIYVYGPDKKKIAESDDTVLGGLDPWLSVVAPETGTYYIKIRQAMDMESAAMHYALNVTSSTRGTIVYPLGGKAGTTFSGTLLGSPEGEKPVQIELPKQVGKFEESMLEYTYPGKQQATIPNLIQVAEFDNVLEDDRDHSSEAKAQVYSGELPIAFNGKIDKEGQRDWYKFTAKKGNRYRVWTYAATLGSPIDVKLTLKATEGLKSRVNISEDDSYFQHRDQGRYGKWATRENLDPVVIFEPDQDGEYLLGIEDSQRMFGPDFAYRVEIQPFVDRTFIKPLHDYREDTRKRDSFDVPAGSTIERTFEYIAVPGNKYQGELEVIAKGLPPGVTCFAGPTKVGSRRVQILMTASKDAKPWAGFIDFELRPKDPDVEFVSGFHLQSPAKWARGGFIDQFFPTRKCAMSVVAPAPFDIKVKDPGIPLVRNAQLELEVEIIRHNYDGELRISTQWLPNNITGAAPISIPAGENKAIYTIKANQNAELGKFPISITLHQDLHFEGSIEREAHLQTGTGFNFVASKPMWINVSDPYLELELARAAIERQKTGEIVATIKTLKPLPGNAKAKLVGLPSGVSQTAEVIIKPGDKTVSFPLAANKDCLLGQYKDISCEVTISEKGQDVTQLTGRGAIRIDEERSRP